MNLDLLRFVPLPWVPALALAVALAGAALPAHAQAEAPPEPCGSLQNHYGPFDYRKERGGKLRVVEKFHFTAYVESLQRAQSSAHVGADLDYVLHVSPNHHRALLATVRLGEKFKTPQPPHMQYSVECYFARALRFQPDDTVARQLYAHYLIRNGRAKDAVKQLEIAAGEAGDNPLTNYNIGLLYLEIPDYDQALAYEHKARGLGLVRSQLRDALKKAGRWREPGDIAAAVPAAAASAAP